MSRLLAAALALSVLAAGPCGCRSMLRVSPLARWERSQVYQPARYPNGNWFPAGLTFEDAWFAAEDGTQLHGWYVPHEDPRAVVLFAHGNAGNLSHRTETLRILHDRHRLSVLIFDYRGYGRSDGVPGERGLLQDARAARAWLAERARVSERDIVLMGRSLGGGVTVDLASSDGARGLVLASTFTSLPEVADRLIPLVPARLLMQDRFDSISKLGSYEGPLLISHGDADEVIPYEMGRRLFDVHRGPKRFITIPGGRHNSEQTEEYRRALDEFIDALPPPSSPAAAAAPHSASLAPARADGSRDSTAP
ncbi:MAG TPA: alpha/beta hydrolase [Planctomycetaceae bacterium]|nr:alpha/beta hydrolase [Planctomycetaceae bacterium]